MPFWSRGPCRPWRVPCVVETIAPGLVPGEVVLPVATNRVYHDRRPDATRSSRLPAEPLALMTSAVPGRVLEWDSAFFGISIGQLDTHRLTVAEADAAVAWARGEGLGCLYFLADSDDAQTVRAAESHGFALVDVRVTLRRNAEVTGPADPRIRAAREDDIPALETIASVSHRDARFYFDGRFPVERCDQLYATWIANSCRGFAQAVFVAEIDGTPAGYITCHRDGTKGSIGLLAVAEASGGSGLGPALVGAAIAWFAQAGCTNVTVVTQGRNVRAQRTYERCGFVVDSLRLWYHFRP